MFKRFVARTFSLRLD